MSSHVGNEKTYLNIHSDQHSMILNYQESDPQQQGSYQLSNASNDQFCK